LAHQCSKVQFCLTDDVHKRLRIAEIIIEYGYHGSIA
jgi:hypothetical protein